MSFRNQRRARGTDSGNGSRVTEPSLGDPSQGHLSITTSVICTVSSPGEGSRKGRVEAPEPLLQPRSDISRHPDPPEASLEMSSVRLGIRRNERTHGYAQRARARPMAEGV